MIQKQATSVVINWLRFPLIFLVILLHGYSVIQIPGDHAAYFKAVYPLALWLGETGVPGFLFISGYLFFLSSKSYQEKLRSRFHSLLIPYMLWNGMLLLAYLAAYTLGHPQDINGKNMADFGWQDYLRLFWDRGTFDNGNFVPLLCPYWYIRNLLILSVCSPIIYVLVRYLREAFLLAVTVWWMLTPHNAFIPQSILFFSLGAYFSVHKRTPLMLFQQRKGLFIGLCIAFGVADIVTHTFFPTGINLQIHRLALIANIPVLFLTASFFASHHIQSSLLTNAAFIVFSVHYPLIVILRKIGVSRFAHVNDSIQILLYLGCVIIATLLSLLVYKLLPTPARNILSGNRA